MASSVRKHIATSAGGLGFNYKATQIGHSVTNGSPPLRCFFETVLPGAMLQRLGRYWLYASAYYPEYNEDLIRRNIHYTLDPH